MNEIAKHMATGVPDETMEQTYARVKKGEGAYAEWHRLLADPVTVLSGERPRKS